MAFQKCPVCNGTGKSVTSQHAACNTCNGTGIIDELTGFPPRYHQNVSTTTGVSMNRSEAWNKFMETVRQGSAPQHKKDVLEKQIRDSWNQTFSSDFIGAPGGEKDSETETIVGYLTVKLSEDHDQD